jgi:hypothetical protein
MAARHNLVTLARLPMVLDVALAPVFTGGWRIDRHRKAVDDAPAYAPGARRAAERRESFAGVDNRPCACGLPDPLARCCYAHIIALSTCGFSASFSGEPGNTRGYPQACADFCTVFPLASVDNLRPGDRGTRRNLAEEAILVSLVGGDGRGSALGVGCLRGHGLDNALEVVDRRELDDDLSLVAAEFDFDLRLEDIG